MAFPPSFIDELKQRLPVSEVVGKVTRLARAGREHKGLCPFHSEKSPSFTVNDDKQFYHCFGCGAHGNIITFVMNQQQLGFLDAVEQLAKLANLPVPQNTPAARAVYDTNQRLAQALEVACRWFQQQLFHAEGRTARNYLTGRGLGDEICEKYRLGYAPADSLPFIRAMQQAGIRMDDLVTVGLLKKSERNDDYYSFFRHRVLFPIGDKRGNIVAFGARLLEGDGPKYINSPDHPLFHKGQLLYGLSRARMAPAAGQPLLVVEGYVDVIALQEAGYSGAVAPLGTALTEAQLQLLWSLLPKPAERDPTQTYHPILCFDGDNAGQRAAARAVARALPLISADSSIRLAFMPAGEDPDSLLRQFGKLAMAQTLEQAQSLADYLWQQTLAGRPLDTPEGKASLRQALGRLTRQIANPTLAQLYAEDFQARLATLFARPSGAAGGSQLGGEARGSASRRLTKAGGNNPRTKGWQPMRSQPLQVPASGPRLREKAMLALGLAHPELWPRLADELENWHCLDSAHEQLRHALVMFFLQKDGQPLDNKQFLEDFSAHITTTTPPLASVLAAVLAPATLRAAGLGNGHITTDQAWRSWQELWLTNQAERLQPEIEQAKQDFAPERLQALQAELQRIMAARNQLLLGETAV